jgi:hypothetical protein
MIREKIFLYNEFNMDTGILYWAETPIDSLNLIKNSVYIYTWEFNILVKAKFFLENPNPLLENITLDERYKEAYDFWQKRQLNTYISFIDSRFNLKSKGWYIPDFTVDQNMYAEICQDLIWIELQLLFCTSVLEHLINNNIKLNSIENSEFKLILKSITNSDLKLYREGYQCSFNLACLKVNEFSKQQIDNFYKIYSKYPLEYKLKSSPYKPWTKGFNTAADIAYKKFDRNALLLILKQHSDKNI